MIRVAIVDDHQLFAEGLAAALGAVPDIEVVATFKDGRAFLDAVDGLYADIVLLDLEMPHTSGTDVLAALGGKTRSLVVSMHSGQRERSEAIRLGADGVLSKSAPLTDVAAAVRAVVAGADLSETSDTTLREILADHQTPQLDPGAASLTERERELLGLMARGVTGTEELAERLFISQKTVKNHLASIYDKLAISDRAQAAVEAIRLGFHEE